MKNALRRIGLHKFANERIKTDEGDIIRIDKNGDIARSGFEPKVYRMKYTAWYDYDPPYYYNSIHEELLLSYCGCYGVDSSDVELLLVYGCSYDEVEEMLVDHDLLREALQDVKFICGEEKYENCYGYGGAF